MSTRATPGAGSPDEAQIDYIYEPSAQEIFNQLLPRYVEVQVYRALLESNAAFFAAQMTAMDTTTKNSADMIASLTLYMNKVRQAAITREIIEVVSGAEALLKTTLICVHAEGIMRLRRVAVVFRSASPWQ